MFNLGLDRPEKPRSKKEFCLLMLFVAFVVSMCSQTHKFFPLKKSSNP